MRLRCQAGVLMAIGTLIMLGVSNRAGAVAPQDVEQKRARKSIDNGDEIGRVLEEDDGIWTAHLVQGLGNESVVERVQGLVTTPGSSRAVRLARGKIVVGVAGIVVFVFLLASPHRQTWWTKWGPPWSAFVIVVYAAASTHRGWGELVAVGALILAALGLRRLSSGCADPWRRIHLGAVAAAGAAYIYASFWGQGVIAAAVLVSTVGLATIVAALHVRSSLAQVVPLLASCTVAAYVAWMTYGLLGVGVVAAGAFALALSLVWMFRGGRDWRVPTERVALVLLAVSAAHAWVNFGTFHGGNSLHYHELFHYVLGSKYFPENRYTYLYHCAAIAEAESGNRTKIAEREVRNLETNELKVFGESVDEVEPCRRSFTPARWVAFQSDVRLMRSFMRDEHWGSIFKDHGYNATPVWTALGSAVSNRDWQSWAGGLPPFRSEEFRRARVRFRERLTLLAAIDAVLYLMSFVLVLWAFGLRAAVLAVLIWAVGYPWGFYWIGGAFARGAWLVTAVAGVCFLKKEHAFLGGFSLVSSALLRVFPAVLLGGLALKMLDRLWHARTLARCHVLFLAGCLLAGGILVPASLSATGGWKTYTEFLANASKHRATPLTNHMGLPTLFAWDEDNIGRRARDGSLVDPWSFWKEKRREVFANRRPLYWAVAIGFVVLLAVSSRRLEDWAVTAASTILIVVLLELTCYYFGFVVLLAPLALSRMRYVVVLIGMAVATQFLPLHVSWNDEQFTAASLLVLGAMSFLLLDQLFDPLVEERDS